MQYAIGIDIGTGSTKAVATSFTGKVVASSQAHYELIQNQTGQSEQDPKPILQAFLSCIREIVVKMGTPPAVIGLSSYMHGVMLIDARDQPLTNIFTWADTRSGQAALQLRQSEEAEGLYMRTGTPIHSMSPICKIIWLKTNKPKYFQQAKRFVSIKEYIWHQLFGEWEVDHSIASAMGLFNIKEKKWDQRALELSGIAEDQLSVPVLTSFTRNRCNPILAAQMGLSPQSLWCIGASDGCMANLGTQAYTPGVAALTIGTSGAVRTVQSIPIYNREAMTFNYILDEELYVSGGPVNNGGNVVQWLLKNFLQLKEIADKDYQELFNTIDKVPEGSEGLLFLPYLYGERAPIWDEQASGAYVGVRSIHQKDHFLRAALEGMCFALLQILTTLEQSDMPVSQLNVSGGFIHSEVWMQVLANITGRKLCLVQTEDASAVGAALLALKARGVIKNYFELYVENEHFINPDHRSRAMYDRLFQLYCSLYPKLKDTLHLLPG